MTSHARLVGLYDSEPLGLKALLTPLQVRGVPARVERVQKFVEPESKIVLKVYGGLPTEMEPT